MTSAADRKFAEEFAEHLHQHISTKFREVVDIMAPESERGCLIVAQSLMDETLGEIFRRIFKHLCPAITESQLNSLTNGVLSPLGGFAKRIDMAYAMGLIDMEVRDILVEINGTRKGGAHSSKFVAFDEKRLGDLVNRVNDRFENHVNVRYPRTMFEGAKAPRGRKKLEPKDVKSLDNRMRFIFCAEIAYIELKRSSLLIEIFGWPIEMRGDLIAAKKAAAEILGCSFSDG